MVVDGRGKATVTTSGELGPGVGVRFSRLRDTLASRLSSGHGISAISSGDGSY